MNQDDIFHALMADEPEMEPPFKIHKKNYNTYLHVLECLEKLKTKGILTYEADDIRDAIEVHCIFVDFKKQTCSDLIDLKANEIAELLQDMDGLVLNMEKGNEWTISIPIYVKGK